MSSELERFLALLLAGLILLIVFAVLIIPRLKRLMRRIRFSLRTLLCVVFLLASGAALWQSWYPWQIVHAFKPDGMKFYYAALDYSPDGLRIAIVGGNNDLRIISASDGKTLAKFTVMGDSRVKFSSDAQFLYAFNRNELVQIDLSKSESNTQVIPNAPLISTEIKDISRDGRQVLVERVNLFAPAGGGQGRLNDDIGKLAMLERTTWAEKYSIQSPHHDVKLGRISPDGKNVVIADPGKVWTWELSSDVAKPWQEKAYLGFHALEFFKNGRVILGANSFAEVWDPFEGRRIDSWPGRLTTVALAPDEETAAATQWDGQVYIWKRMRCEGKWDPLGFPALWITGVFAVLMAYSLWRDWIEFRKKGSQQDPHPLKLNTLSTPASQV